MKREFFPIKKSNEKKRAFSSSFPFIEEIFFPRRCLGCDVLLLHRGNSLFCERCFHAFLPLRTPLCAVCGEPVNGSAGVCERCLRRPPPYTLCRSLFIYNHAMRQLVLQFKSRRDRLFYAGIAELCREADLDAFSSVDLAAPVPLHPARLRKRGFNQSLLLCRLFFGGNKDVKIVPKLLERIKNTTPQSGLGRKERLVNLKKMFRICGDNSLYGKRICLVDDVITTGSTVEECCKSILKSGAYSVSVLSLARTLRHEDKGAGDCS